MSLGEPLDMDVAGTELMHWTSMLGARRRYGPTCGFATLPEVGLGPLSVPQIWGTPLLLGLGRTLVAIRSHRITNSPLQLRVWARWGH
jgi:hypothetical protein